MFDFFWWPPCFLSPTRLKWGSVCVQCEIAFHNAKNTSMPAGAFLLKCPGPEKRREIMRESTSSILAQKGRLIAYAATRRVVALLVLPFVGIVAAFGIAPDTATDAVPRTQVIEELAIPSLATPNSAVTGYWREERVRRDDTLGTLLSRLGVEDADAFKYVRSLRTPKGLAQLVPGRTMRAQTTVEGKLIALR